VLTHGPDTIAPTLRDAGGKAGVWCDGLEAQLTAARTTGAHLLDATLRQLLAA